MIRGRAGFSAKFGRFVPQLLSRKYWNNNVKCDAPLKRHLRAFRVFCEATIIYNTWCSYGFRSIIFSCQNDLGAFQLSDSYLTVNLQEKNMTDCQWNIKVPMFCFFLLFALILSFAFKRLTTSNAVLKLFTFFSNRVELFYHAHFEKAANRDKDV